MHEEDLQPRLESLAPRFEALGLGDIAARLLALVGPEPMPEARDVPQFGSLLTKQLLSILGEATQS